MNDIILGDCLEEMKKIQMNSVDMILTDLPYGTTACKWDEIINMGEMWDLFNHVSKETTPIILTASQPFTSKLIISNIDNFKYCWVWDKVLHSNPLIAKRQPLSNYEDICVFYKKQCTYNPQMEIGNIIKRGGSKTHNSETKGLTQLTTGDSTKERYPKRIIRISNADKTNNYHPTQKPVELFEYLIKTYSNEGDTVLDCTAGSGTTGVACKNLNRNYILIEKEQKYYDIIKERLK